MGVSYSIIPISEVQKEKDYIEYIDSIEKYGTLDIRTPDNDSRYPTLDEIYYALSQAEIVINSETISLDEFEFRKGNRLVIHSLSIKDEENEFDDDLTVRYTEPYNKNDFVNSILGIKSNIRILIKFVTRLTKICGPFIILSPYEVCLIEKSLSYEQIIKEIKGKLL